MIRLRSHGIYTFQIVDPKLFVVKMVGTRGIFTNAQIEDFLRGVIIGRFADILGESLDTVLDLPRYFDELGAGLKARPRTTSPSTAWPWSTSSSTPSRRRRTCRSASTSAPAWKPSAAWTGTSSTRLRRPSATWPRAAAVGRWQHRRRLGRDGRARLGDRRRPRHDDPRHVAAGHGRRSAAQGPLPELRQDIAFGSNFCPECGPNFAATVACPECDTDNQVGAKFCANCGYKMECAAAPAVRAAPQTRATQRLAAATAPERRMRAAQPKRCRLWASDARPRMAAGMPLAARFCSSCCSGSAALRALAGPAGRLGELVDRLHRRRPRRSDERRRDRRREGHLHLRRQLPLRHAGHPHANIDGITDIAVHDANGAVLPEGDGPGTYSTAYEGGVSLQRSTST